MESEHTESHPMPSDPSEEAWEQRNGKIHVDNPTREALPGLGDPPMDGPAQVQTLPRWDTTLEVL